MLSFIAKDGQACGAVGFFVFNGTVTTGLRAEGMLVNFSEDIQESQDMFMCYFGQGFSTGFSGVHACSFSNVGRLWHQPGTCK